jgi:hypothetical protein
VELSYVYEVDAEDMPEVESQVLPEDEPVISVSASTAEVPDDEALPFESRKAGEGESEVPSPKSETQGAGPGAQPSPKDPRPVDCRFSIADCRLHQRKFSIDAFTDD